MWPLRAVDRTPVVTAAHEAGHSVGREEGVRQEQERCEASLRKKKA